MLLLVLPGFLAYRFAVARRADPARRSTLWQLAAISEYSVYVHVVGVALVLAAAWLLHALFRIDSHLSELPGKGPQEFLIAYFAEGVLLFTLYPVYVVLGAILMGAYDLPSWIASTVVRSVSVLTRKIGSIPGLNWIRSPRPAYSAEPIWHHAFSVKTNTFTKARPFLLVRMKRGDVYYGELASYPLLPDSQKGEGLSHRESKVLPRKEIGSKERRLDDHRRGWVRSA